MLPRVAPRLLDLVSLHTEHARRTCAKSTLTAYRKAYRRIWVPGLGGNATVSSIRRGDVRRVHAEHAATPAAANLALSVLRSGWLLAEDMDWAAPGTDPTRAVRRHPEARKQRPLSPDETRQLWDACMDCLAGRSTVIRPEMAIVFALVLATGMRRNEAASVLLADVDLELGVIVVRHHKTERSRGPKEISLGPDIHALLVSYLSGRSGEYAFPSPRSKTGRPYRELNRGWRRICDACDIAGACIRDARSGIATAALDAGEELRAIQHQLGHASITTTARYARVTPRRALEAAARMEAAALRTTRYGT